MRAPRLVASGLMLAVWVSTVPGLLPTSVARAAAPSANDGKDELHAEAGKLYDEGRGKFETADYKAAIELWTKAYTILPATAAYAKIKVLLLYDLATARERAFEVDNRASHLRQARILLENFEANIPAIYGHGHEGTAERERVLERLAALDAVLADVGEDSAEVGEVIEDPGAPTPVVMVEAEPADTGTGGRNKKRLVLGGVMLGLGAGSLGLMAGGFVMGNNANNIDDLDPDDIEGRRALFDRGRTGNVLAVVGGVVGGALIITGAVLMGTSNKKPSQSARVVPTVGPDFAGFAAVGRF